MLQTSICSRALLGHHSLILAHTAIADPVHPRQILYAMVYRLFYDRLLCHASPVDQFIVRTLNTGQQAALHLGLERKPSCPYLARGGAIAVVLESDGGQGRTVETTGREEQGQHAEQQTPGSVHRRT